MSAEAFTRLHVGVSLVALAAALVTLLAMIGRRGLPGVTALFLAASILTGLSDGIFAASRFGAQQIVAIVSLAALAIAVFALYVRRLAGVWRAAYVLSATLALWLNVALAVRLAFQTVPALAILAPTETEPPYFAAQGGVLVLFVCLAALAFNNFPGPAAPKSADRPDLPSSAA
ncbi:MAG TPA: hypothetical protein VME40_04075 [Caulobacteraceae bacterium]|nr:hypothetical protein [Caulobacteraceae bacterium]